jgi:uncharacterized protein YhdP
MMKGKWQDDPAHPLTQSEIDIKSHNVEGFLRRFGQNDVIHRGKAELKASLQWKGTPFALNYATLEGQVALQASKGQFAQIDPGAGRLLGVLSLQALPRRMRLDFRDVFSKGLAFDVIEGNSHIQQGIAHTDDLVIIGPAAQILFQGKTDLANQTQDLTVRIIPEWGNGVAIAAGVLVNPFVGMGTFLLQHVLKGPMGQLAAYEYAMTGTWKNPIITKLHAPVKQ